MKQISFMPTIFEHAAFLIGQTPSSAAYSAELMAQAHIEAYKQYGHGVVTVGIDVYNIEAEAIGCTVQVYDDNSIPGIAHRALTLDDAPDDIVFSVSSGRIQTVLDAASQVKRVIGDDVPVSVGICGPYSILIELLGYEHVMNAIYDSEEKIVNFLDALLDFQKCYCDEIISRGLGVSVFESWASPPLTSPGIYQELVLPYEQKLFSYLKILGTVSCPLIIGGDTSSIAEDILESGTTLLLSDYNTPLTEYVEMARKKGISLRVNIDPKLVYKGAWDEISCRIKEIYTHYDSYDKILIGTGVIPYDTPPGNIIRIKQLFDFKN